MSIWYTNKNLKPQGPFSFEEIKHKIRRGEVGPEDLVAKEGQAQWQPAKEWSDLSKDLFPAFQKNLFRGIDKEEKEWTLLAMRKGEPVQEGPFSLNHIRDMVLTGRATHEDFIWRTGLTGWLKIKDRPDLFTLEPSNGASEPSLDL